MRRAPIMRWQIMASSLVKIQFKVFEWNQDLILISLARKYRSWCLPSRVALLPLSCFCIDPCISGSRASMGMAVLTFNFMLNIVQQCNYRTTNYHIFLLYNNELTSFLYLLYFRNKFIFKGTYSRCNKSYLGFLRIFGQP